MIIRGTTPTIVLTVTDYELQGSEELHVYFSVNKKLFLEKETPDVQLDTEAQTVIVPLTQEDTFALKTGEVKIQFRLKTIDGMILGSSEVFEEVSDIDDEDEVI